MARARTHTFLTLDRYAQTMGINPLHFNGGSTPDIDEPIFVSGGCDDIWPQYDWQDADRVSRDHLARIIHGVESDIADLVGFFPAPQWVEEEPHDYIRPYLREAFGNGTDIRGSVKGIRTDYGKYISGGRRALTTVGAAKTSDATLVYSDDDGDGFYETATISIAIPDTVPDAAEACEFKVFFDGYTYPDWEIRYPETAEISGGNIILTFRSWLFIDQDELDNYPTAEGFRAVNVSAVDNFVDEVDVYYEYNDFSQASAQFIWETGSSVSCSICGGLGCEACGLITQDGCARASMSKNGIVRPTPAEYDADNEEWGIVSFSENVEPDMVKLWYYSGDQSQEYIRGRSCDPLSHFWAETITYMATAKLKRNLCGCPSVKNTVEYWQTDLGKLETNVSYFQRDDITNSPFGTLRGEVHAWTRIKHFVKDKRVSVAVI